jgi:hypothetical protein
LLSLLFILLCVWVGIMLCHVNLYIMIPLFSLVDETCKPFNLLRDAVWDVALNASATIGT